MRDATTRRMQVNSVEELQVWQTARRFVEAVSALTRERLAGDRPLRDQIDACTDSILANLAEGFEQGSDRAFARYLYICRGSCAEVKAHLVAARLRGHVPDEAAAKLFEQATDIGRMLTGLINYLLRSDRKHRR